MRRAPENPDAHFSLGVAYLQAGEVDSSVREFERVVALRPSSGRAHANLALLYWLKHDYPGADREAASARKAGVQPSSGLANAIREAVAR